MWTVPVCDIAKIPRREFQLLSKRPIKVPLKEQLKSGQTFIFPKDSKPEYGKKSVKYPVKRKISKVSYCENGNSEDEMSNSEYNEASNSENKESPNSENEESPNSENEESSNSENVESSNSENDETSNSENDEASNSENNEASNSENIDKIQNKENQNEDSPSEQENELGEYEKMILKNKRDKMAFLQSLKINEIAQDIVAFKKRNYTRVDKDVAKKVERTPPPPRRKSLRISKDQMNLSEDALFTRSFALATKQQEEEQAVKKVKPAKLKFAEALVLEEKSLCKVFAQDFSYLKQASKNKESLVQYDSKCFKNLKITKSQVAKVVMSRISSMAMHPSSTKVLVSAGSKYGQIGFWDLECTAQHDGLYLFEPHDGNITCQAFNPDNWCQLITSSYDGTLRCADLEKMVFNEVYRSDDETLCSYFDFISSSTYLISQRTGSVVLVDSRRRIKAAVMTHQSHNCALKTVNVHPVDKNYFITAGNNGIVSLWDLRKLQKTSISDLHHNKCVNSAYFSPITGNRILTTSTDDKISIFNSEDMTFISKKAAISHNNYVTRWLTCFRATWLPNTEDFFAMGSMLNPRRIEIYNEHGNIVHNLQDEELNSITSVHVFHPSRPVLCAGNSSGKVYAFLSR